MQRPARRVRRNAEDLLLALLRSHCIELCPPLLHVLALAVWTGDFALLVLGNAQDFREFFLSSSTQRTVLGPEHLPIESFTNGNPHRHPSSPQFPPSPNARPANSSVSEHNEE